MKIYKPFRDTLLVEKVESKNAIIAPDGRWLRLRVLAVGPLVVEKIKPGDIVIAENLLEKVDLLTEQYIILSKYIWLQEEEDGKSVN